MKICPQCKSLFADSENFCQNCGIPLTVFLPSDEPPQQSPEYHAEQTVQPPQQAKNKQKSAGPIIIAVAAIILAAAVSVSAYFIVKTIKNDKNSDNANAVVITTEPKTEDPTTQPPVAETTTQTVTTTYPVVITAPPPEARPDNSAAYEAFSYFYVSYLDAINSLDTSYIEYCTPDVKREMAGRIDYNAKSFFDLSRLDYDNDSMQIGSNGGYSTYTFYVKCVSQKYNRSDRAKTDLNYAVWLVTVTDMGAGNFVVSNMERNDKYVLSSNITRISDNSSIF